MTYRGEEIYARCYVPGSDLFELEDDGSLGESVGVYIEHEDDIEVVWFETEFDYGEQHETIDDVKEAIDKWLEEIKDEV